jgi:hypothetical protein
MLAFRSCHFTDGRCKEDLMQKIIGEILSFVNMIYDKVDQLAIFADEVKKSEWRGSQAFRL